MKQKVWIAVICLFLFGSMGAGIFGFLRSEEVTRRTDIKIGKVYLQEAYDTYLKEGRVSKSNNPYYEIWAFTNIVKIGDVEYQCCVAGRFGKRFGGRTLVMATNGIYIWMRDEKPVKIIGDDYKPQFFPPDF